MTMHARDDLRASGPQRVYEGRSLEQISFPLGGIGTGSVGLTGYGGFRDWEIFGRPNLGPNLPFTFPLIYAKARGEDPHCRVAMGPLPPPYIGSGGGDPCANGEGFPHMDGCTFRGEYPFAQVDFACRKLPLKIALEAYNPYIPSEADDSGYPAAILRYTLTNTTRKTVDTTLAWSIFNPVGTVGAGDRDPVMPPGEWGHGKNVNRYVEQDGLRGIEFLSRKWKKRHPRYGNLAIMTPEKNVTVMPYWSREPGFAPRHDLWDTFSETGALPEHEYGPTPEGQSTAGALGVKLRLRPGASRTITFYLTWYFPNFEKYWHCVENGSGACCGDAASAEKPVWPHYYAKQFSGAVDVAAKLHGEEKRLYRESMRFHDALFSSTMPPYVLDAVSSQMAILKTTTCLRLPDGTFYGFEGCSPGSGCCEGSCTHVWNYQQALPFLFPELERSMRSADYRHNFREDGSMGFRINLPLGSPANTFLACADGQLGGVIKAYRDWKICGDDGWLHRLWPRIKASLEYAWKDWDPKRRGVLDGIQHNTYDIEFHGPNPLTEGFYLGALAAGAEMADHFGDLGAARDYRELLERGHAWVEHNLYNGAYYEQKYNPEKAPTYQFGSGCLSDQMLGQWITSLTGLGYVFDPRRVRTTLRAIFRNNWKADLREHANAQRVYAVGEESGLVLCTWPEGGRPRVPFLYSDEVWTGIEYHVASHCIMEGLVDEGLIIARGARDRHDGIRRNPWDEFECGHHYARAMSSYGLLLALSGFRYDAGNGVIGFAPKIHAKKFRSFWALDGVWGVFEQRGKQVSIEVLHGEVTLSRIDLPTFRGAKKATVTLGKRQLRVDMDAFGSITLPRTIHLRAGKTMHIKIT